MHGCKINIIVVKVNRLVHWRSVTIHYTPLERSSSLWTICKTSPTSKQNWHLRLEMAHKSLQLKKKIGQS